MARWYLIKGHPRANEFHMVAEADVGDWSAPDEKLAVNAGVLVGRFYENTKALDGTDIGSRKKHREYMKRHNLAIATDFTETWKKAAEDRKRIVSGTIDRRERREQIERAAYELERRRK